MIVASTTFRCHGCGQLLPFDGAGRVPDACLRRCQGRCDWHAVGPTAPQVRARATVDGPPGPDGLPGDADGLPADADADADDPIGLDPLDRPRPERAGTAG